MPQPNLDRMIKLADEFFETKNDPLQISVSEETMVLLRKIHPNTISEISTEDGPIAWLLIIPTTQTLMKLFLAKKISEQNLLYDTPLNARYEALYLCSALVLPEHRGKGLAKRLALTSIRAVIEQHPIKQLFYWGFSPEGDRLASSIARDLGLPLGKRPD